MNNFSSSFFIVLIFTVTLCVAQKMEKQLASQISCNKDADCLRFSRNSLCIGNTVEDEHSGICYCLKDFIPQQNRTHFDCLSTPRNFTDSCKEDVQCQVAFSNWAFCNNAKGQCQCREGSHFMTTKCYQTIKLGETCSFKQQCLLKSGDTATCLAGTCSCGHREHPVSGPDGESCEMSRELGEDCNTDAQCTSENSRCFGTCRCKPGYTTQGDGRSCLKEAEKLGDYCLEDPQCESISNNTYCENFFCRCRNHHHVYLDKCYKNVRLNGTCTNHRECWFKAELNETLHCKEGICTCTYKFTEDGTKCINSGINLQKNYFLIVFGFVFIWKLMKM